MVESRKFGGAVKGFDRSPGLVHFEGFQLDLRAGELRQDGGKTLRLPEQPFRILTMLLERPGEVLTREDIRKQLWPNNTIVEFEHSISAAMNRLRQALGDSAEEPHFIETLPRRGYRFIGSVNGGIGGYDAAPVIHSTPWLAVALGTITVMVLGLLGLNVGGWRDRLLRKNAPSTEKIRLAVLPFEDLGHDPSQEYFTDGVTEEMIEQLGRLQPERLGVIARGSVMHYKHSDQSADRVAKELGVQYILEGSVRHEGHRVRITAQLIDARDRTHLLAQDYDGDLSDVLALQLKVAQRVADAIRLKLTPQKNAAGLGRRSVDPEAYQLYLRARYELNRSWYKGGPARLKTALALFNQAAQMDSSYAPAYAGLAEAYMMSAWFETEPARAAAAEADGNNAADRALQLDDSLADAHLAKAFYLWSQWDWDAMEKEARRATELDPNYAHPRQMYAVWLLHLGRLKDSWDQLQLASTLDPMSNHSLLFLGHYYLAARQWDKLIETSEIGVKADPDYLVAYGQLAEAYLEKGRFADALQAMLAGSQAAGDDMKEVNQYVDELRKAYETGGAKEFWKKVLQGDLDEAEREGNFDALNLAIDCARVGDTDQAFAWLEKGYQLHSFHMVMLKLHNLDNLHSDPRWNDLLRRMNLPQ
jgi:TolB-like protein/DNA-binding winged helix-turn-helix (wHTH) protein/Tfp pilus assembly protein PilF